MLLLFLIILTLLCARSFCVRHEPFEAQIAHLSSEVSKYKVMLREAMAKYNEAFQVAKIVAKNVSDLFFFIIGTLLFAKSKRSLNN